MTTFDSLPVRTSAVGHTRRARLCAGLGGVCRLLRAAHAARVPF